MVIIYFPDRPSEALVRTYEQLLEDFLSAHSAKVKIILHEQYIDGQMTVDGRPTDITRRWIDKVLLTTPEVKDLEVGMFNAGIDGDSTIDSLKVAAWTDAYHMQNALYKHLHKSHGHPDNGDPYWELSKKRPKRT